jgi:RNA polymerase sigma-70 factor (ECF subfamily)
MSMPGNPPSDHALIDGVVRHDELALASLYDRFSGLVYAVALRITGDRPVSEEVVQDVFHAVWRTAAGFQPGGSVAAWIVGIARHRAIDATRSRTYRARRREQEIAPAIGLAASELTDEQVERQLSAEQVRAALRELPASQREALDLAYYAGLTQAEIAARTQTPIGTVKARLRLGLLHLRRQLDAPRVGTEFS